MKSVQCALDIRLCVRKVKVLQEPRMLGRLPPNLLSEVDRFVVYSQRGACFQLLP